MLHRKKQVSKSGESPKHVVTPSHDTASHIGGAVLALTPANSDPFKEMFKEEEEREEKARFPSRFTERQFKELDDIRTVTALSEVSQLEQPTDKVIESLRKDDPRIDVVHATVNSDIFASKLDEDFAGHEVIAIRAIEASLDGLVTDGGYDTHDIRDILRVGDIKMRPSVNLAGFRPGQDMDDFMRIHYRVAQFGSQTDCYREYEVGGSVDGVGRIFPVVLVYDTALVSDRADGYYGYRLPDTDDLRSQAILKAYVFDAEISTLMPKH